MKKYSDQRGETATDLHNERLEKITQILLEGGAESVLDLGCGSGDLLVRLSEEDQFRQIVGIDTSQEALAAARNLLAQQDCQPDNQRVSLYHDSFTALVEELTGFDAAVMLETIEHIDPQRLSAVERAVFAGYAPRMVLITTPNLEYNPLHGLPEGTLRHQDHRFEWTRDKFRRWAEGVAGRNGYRVVFEDIGPVDLLRGSSTQMAVFCRI